MKNKVTINKKQGLYVIPCGTGYTCLGFDVLQGRAARLAAELGEIWNAKRGTLKAYAAYSALCDMAANKNRLTGWRSASELTPQLIGLDGKRVEVVDSYGERRRFKVGKSTGYIPCHIELKRRDSMGGGAVFGAPFHSVAVLS